MFNYLNVMSQIGLPMVKNYSPEDYEGGIQNWQILQDERGVIYVANNFGLLQFDGNDWRNYTLIGNSKLRSIAQGSNNKIYVGYQGDLGYYEKDDQGSLVYTSLKEMIPLEHQDIDETWKIYIINDIVYFCTFSNIYVFDQQKISVIESNYSLDISFSTNRQIYSYVNGIGLFVLENDKFMTEPFTPFFKEKKVSGMLSHNLQEILVLTNRSGIYITDKSSTRVWNQALNELFSKTFINCAILLSNGNIAIGTQHNGIYIVDQKGTIVLHMNNESGLLSRTILSLFEDKNNNLWIGQNNGISFVELKSPFRKLNEESNLPGTGYAALKKNNELYLGTNNGVYHNKRESMHLIEGSEGQVYNIQSINEAILIGHNNGALILKNNQAKLIDNSIGTWMFLKYGNLLLKGTYEGINILNAKKYSNIAKVKGLYESSRILVQENDSTIWMSHIYKGVYRIQLSSDKPFDSKIEYFNKDNQLPSDLSNVVHKIDGKIVVSTQSGIFEYASNQNKFIVSNSLNEFFKGDKVLAMKNDVYGNIYFITTEAVGFLENLGNKEYIKHASPFNPIRKLLNDDLANINIISPNLIFFGAKEGFIIFDRNLFWTTEKEDFSTIIRQVRSDGNDFTLLYNGDDFDLQNNQKEPYPEIAYDNNSLSFLFSSTTFSANILPEFQYRLEGFDENWLDWTSNNFKEYTNLREGLYTFKVKSRNSSKEESEIQSYSFIIIYPWYRSPLAYIIFVLAFIALLISIVLSLDKKHQNEKNELEEKRVSEISEKEIEIDNITKQSEDEINLLKTDKLKSEIKHMNTELATNTMHILNKNEFINSIKSSLGRVVAKSTNNEVKSTIKRVMTDIEKNIKTDGDWQSFQIHFDKVHGDFTSRFKHQFPSLSPQEMKLSAYLRLNLSTKEIANLLNITVRGVEIARYRLRKKLALDRNQNLAEFILNY